MPIKARIVNVMGFSVTIHGSENGIIRQTEQKIDHTSERWCWRKLLRVSQTVRRVICPTLEEVKASYSLEALIMELKHEYFGHKAKIRLTREDPNPWKNRRQ